MHGSVESLAAHLTGKRLHARVYEKVLVQTPLVGESLLAEVACIRLFTRVSHQMHFQGALVEKRFGTQVASERSLAVMGETMALQACFQRVSVRAQVTGVWLFLSVGQRGFMQISRLVSVFTTNRRWTRTFSQLHSFNLHVEFKLVSKTDFGEAKVSRFPVLEQRLIRRLKIQFPGDSIHRHPVSYLLM